MEERTTEVRVDHRIRVPQVYVINDDGTVLGTYFTQEALRLAQEKGLNLVEVQPKAKPPVCRLMDYGKYKYLQKKKHADASKSQKISEVKEIQMFTNIAPRDLDTKINHIIRFLTDGNKAKVMVKFRGREITHQEIGRQLLSKIEQAILSANIGKIELPPKLEGKNLLMIFDSVKQSYDSDRNKL